MMNKIFLEGERGADLEVDASLIDDLENVGLCAEMGSIKVKDLTAYAIRLASRMGDIHSEGTLDGNVIAEVSMGDGDFLASSIHGPSSTVSTDSGDITVWSECRSERSHFFTRNGNISI